MKQLVRTKSDTDFFTDKSNLTLINENIKKLKYVKLSRSDSRSTTINGSTNKIKRKNNSSKLLLNQSREKDKSFFEAKSTYFYPVTENIHDSYSAPVNEEVTEESFKMFLKSICIFRYDLKKQYLNKDVYYKKIFLNIQLEILLARIKALKDDNLKIYMQEIRKKSCDDLISSIYESPLSISTYDGNIDNNNQGTLKEKFDKLENVLQIFIRSSAEELFREVKTMMINEYYKTSLEIENFLQLNNKHSELIEFSAISDTSLFIISKFSFLLDFYSISSHSAVDKLQRFYITYLEKAHKFENNPSVTVWKYLDLIYKFIKLKKEFIKEFCQNGISSTSTEIENTELFINSKFTYNKFNSFGLYFFNNLFVIIDSVSSGEYSINPKKKEKILESPLIEIISPPKSKRRNRKNNTEFSWNCIASFQNRENKRLMFSNDDNKLCKVFKLYFTSKMAVWKYISVQGEKTEVCRMCEKTFSFDEYMLHVFNCKYQKYYSKKISELNSNLAKICEELKLYKEKLTKDLIDGNKATDIFFSPLSELNQRFRMHLIEKTPKLIGKNSLGSKKKEAEVELLNTLMVNLRKEKDQSDYEYEKNPNRLIQLISMINFTVIIFNQNLSSNTFSTEINGIFSNLLIILMNKLKMIENVLTFNDNKDKVINKTNDIKQRKLIALTDSPYIGVQSKLVLTKCDTPDKESCLNSLVNNGSNSKNGSAKNLSKLVDEKLIKFRKHSNSNTNLKKTPTMNSNLNAILFKQQPREVLSQLSNLTKPETSNKIDITANRIKEVRNKLKLGADDKQSLSKNSFIVTRDNVTTETESSLGYSPVNTKSTGSNEYFKDKENNSNYTSFKSGENTSDNSSKNLRDNSNSNNNNQTSRKKSVFQKINIKSSKFSASKSVLLSPGRNVITTNYVYFNEKNANQDASFEVEENVDNVDKNMEENYFNLNDSDNIGNYIPEIIDDPNSIDINNKYETDSQYDEIIDLMDELEQSKDKTKEKKLNMTEIQDEMENDSSNSSVSVEKDHKHKEPLKISNFQFIKPISKGGYGRVDIYKKISTGDIFAIKTVNINAMKKKNVDVFLKKETLILHEVDNDYIVKCFYIFSDSKNYYFVMEYLPGGDLLSLLNHLILKPDTIRLIVAEVILALEYLHSINIVHRDLKPENIVISKEGHIKLTDFGISELGLTENKFALSDFDPDSDFMNEENTWNRSKKIIGTENYMAPEAIKNEEITCTADYWALGVLIYELHTNKLPYMADRKTLIFGKILNNEIDWKPFNDLNDTPKGLFSEPYLKTARDLISKFLVIEKNNRWDYGKINEIKNHPFFKNFDWKTFRNNKINSQMYVHLQKQLKSLKEKTNQQFVKKESYEFDKNTDTDGSANYSEQIFSTERVDNLFKKCMELIKNKAQINPDSNNITNVIFDMD